MDARGIDIDSLECVVNYEVPRDLETSPTVLADGSHGQDGASSPSATQEELKVLICLCSRNYLEKQELYVPALSEIYSKR